MPHRLTSLLALALLSGCTRVSAPSLAPRPLETRTLFGAQRSTAVAAPIDADFERQVSAALARALAGEAPYAALLSAARRLVEAAAGDRDGTERWVAAQQALSATDAARAPAAIALDQLNALQLEVAKRDTAVSTETLSGALARVSALEAEQRAAYEALLARLTG